LDASHDMLGLGHAQHGYCSAPLRIQNARCVEVYIHMCVYVRCTSHATARATGKSYGQQGCAKVIGTP
jgi:hypothetical protein